MEQTLYFKQGSSDKVYHASIQARDGGHIVVFAYGRRGSTLAVGTKTQSPVGYEEAKRIFDKLVREKMAKGYTPGEDGTPYQHNGKAESGILPQLLNAIDESEVDQFIQNLDHWMQEKFDGRRLLIKKIGDTVTGINRRGLTVGLPLSIESAARVFSCDFILDGESVGDTVHAFDLLSVDGRDLRPASYNERYVALLNLLASGQQQAIQLVETAFLPRQKRGLFEQMKAQGREGVVFKLRDARYSAGRPASGGPQLKFKFCESASFIVNRVNTKRSVSLMLFNGDRVVPAGNVTIPPNYEVPEVGTVVECRFLYAFRESGAIFQPVFCGSREDITAEECTVDQLKYKAEAA